MGLGLDSAGAEGLSGFSKWFVSKIGEAIGRQNIKLIVEFVKDGTIETGLGHGRFIASLERLTIQLQPAGANVQTFVHELAEAMILFTNWPRQ